MMEQNGAPSDIFGTCGGQRAVEISGPGMSRCWPGLLHRVFELQLSDET
jgi:hypothetical protein